MSERYSNFGRAQRERGPYYKGPPILPVRRIAYGFLAMLAAAVAIGLYLGWFW